VKEIFCSSKWKISLNGFIFVDELEQTVELYVFVFVFEMLVLFWTMESKVFSNIDMFEHHNYIHLDMISNLQNMAYILLDQLVLDMFHVQHHMLFQMDNNEDDHCSKQH